MQLCIHLTCKISSNDFQIKLQVKMELNDTETQIFLNLQDFTRFIPVFINKWTDILNPLLKKVKGIVNMSEQLQAVVETHIEYMPDFQRTQETLQYNILQCIEQDLKYVKETIDKLSRINTQVKDKLCKCEISSLELDWDREESILLQGSPLIPPLGTLLQDSLEFYTFFDNAYKHIKLSTATLSYLDADKMKVWEDSFVLNLEHNQCINHLIAITQYIDNEFLI